MIKARLRVTGVIFIALIVGGVYLTYAIFSQKFVSFDRVTLETSSVGLQLPARADVKIRGVIVGEVLDMSSDAAGAKLTLGIYPSQIDTIPKTVTASIVPKTLFGEKYVSLDIPQGVTSTQVGHLETGDVIDRTQVSIEVEAVLSDLYPLLRTVQPAKLNETLNAISTALDGRGNQIGENLVTLDNYLKKLNPQVPKLADDFHKTISVANTYADVLPKVASILRNTITTTTTLRDRRQQVDALFSNVTGFADTTRGFLETNGDNLIQLGKVGTPQLNVLARYSPEFPCLLRGVVNADKRQSEAFRNFTLHIVLETLPRQPRAYNASDKAVYGDDRGPSCLQLPSPDLSQTNPLKVVPNFVDGVNSPTGKGTDRVAPNYFRNSADYVGSSQETSILKSLIAPGMGLPAADVPDIGPLLLGPMVRGSKVSLR